MKDAREDEVFTQDLSLEDLDAVGGGDCGATARAFGGDPSDVLDDDLRNCTNDHYRPIYGGGGFPNCAATVGDGSWCGTNDACNKNAVEYYGKKDCGKARR